MIISVSDLACIWTLVVSLTLASSQPSPNDDCQLLQSTVPITRMTTIVSQGFPINFVCRGEVVLNKCEGTCESSVSPSVTTRLGFKKNCRCCKETSVTSKEVTLTSCVNNGKIFPKVQHRMLVKEITGCECQACTG